MKKILLTVICIALFILAYSQDSTVAQLDREQGGMRANEKIYVVAAVLGTILAGLFIYIIRLDKKIGRMEKEK
jgi:hypothetical protein